MTMYVHGERASRVRRRRRTAVALVLLAAPAGGAGWYLWGPDTATAQGTRAGLSTTGVHASAAVPEAAAVPQDPKANVPGTTAPPDTGAAPPDTATGLDAELARRFAAAQKAAAAAGVELTLTSGWRSAADQQALVDQAVSRYGSVAKAHRWVLPPETSEHVKGLAIDVGPTAGALWLGKHAQELRLCRTYANEMWHFEKLADGARTCPELHPDALWGW